MKTISEITLSSPFTMISERSQFTLVAVKDWRKKMRCCAMHLLLAIGLVSCVSTQPQSHASTKASPPVRVTDQWVKVSSNPPTYYPRGTSSDCPTDFYSGEWVHTGDDKDTRYFIPLRGLSDERRKKLIHEALATRSPHLKNQIARENASSAARDCAKTLFYLSPPGWFVAMSQMPENQDQKFDGSGWPGAGNVSINPSVGSINCPSGTVGCPVGGVAGR